MGLPAPCCPNPARSDFAIPGTPAPSLPCCSASRRSTVEWLSGHGFFARRRTPPHPTQRQRGGISRSRQSDRLKRAYHPGMASLRSQRQVWLNIHRCHGSNPAGSGGRNLLTRIGFWLQRLHILDQRPAFGVGHAGVVVVMTGIGVAIQEGLENEAVFG